MKSNLDKHFKTDAKMEKEGIWFDINDTAGFRLTRFGGENSPGVKAALAKYYKPYAAQLEIESLSPEKEREIFVRVFVESCVVDWRGIDIDGEENVPFDKEKAIALLIGLPDLFETLRAQASKSEHYKVDLGNS